MSATTIEASLSTLDRSQVSLRITGAWIAAVGFAGICVVSILYVLAPPAAAAPSQPLDPVAAAAGAVEAARLLYATSLVGIASDLVAAAGTMLITLDAAQRGHGLAAAGWTGILLSILVFVFVDSMVGLVLPPLAAKEASAFVGFKLFFDTLFLVGTAAFGLGAITALIGEWQRPAFGVSRSARLIGLVIGCVALIGAIGCLFGSPLQLVAGGGIGCGALIFTWISVEIARA